MIEARSFYLRHPETAWLTTRDRFIALAADGTNRSFGTADPGLWAHLLNELLTAPVPGHRLLAMIGDRVGGAASSFEALLESGEILAHRDATELTSRRDELLTQNRGFHFAPMPRRCGHLVVALTGSIVSGLLAPALLSLAYTGFQERLDLIFTKSALRFVNRELFEYYGIRTWVDAFDRREGITVPHIALGKTADCIVVLPASAASFQRLADGMCTDLLSMTVSATTAPVVLAPTMNDHMLAYPPIRRNIERVRNDGCWIVEPTLFVEAAEVTRQGTPAVGMAGTFWQGAVGIMQVVSAVLEHASSRTI